MKKRNVVITGLFAVLLSITLLVANSGEYHAITKDELDPKEQLHLQSIAVHGAYEGEESAYEYIAKYSSDISANVVQYFIDYGYFGNHVEDLKAMGYTTVDYSAVTGSLNSSTTKTQPAEPAKTPESFTVEAYSPAKTMWATQIVNCREGASIEYNKIGSLTEDEEVSVTGIASTGWYQITREDGTIVYVSEKYLTEKEPTTEEMVIEMVSEAAEESQIKEEEAIPEPTLEPTPEQTATSEPTIEPTMEPTQEPAAESVVEPTVNDTTVKRNFSTLYMVVGLVVAIVIGIGAVIIVKKKRK